MPDESVLSQRKGWGSDVYPEVTWLGQQFAKIQVFREWSFGRYVTLRQPQPADLQTDILLPDSRNLGLLLNELEHSDVSAEFNRLLTRFLPRYQRFSTRIQGGTVQFYLHESGLKATGSRNATIGWDHPLHGDPGNSFIAVPATVGVHRRT